MSIRIECKSAQAVLPQNSNTRGAKFYFCLFMCFKGPIPVSFVTNVELTELVSDSVKSINVCDSCHKTMQDRPWWEGDKYTMQESLSEDLIEKMVKVREEVKRNKERKRKRKMQRPACLVKRAAGRAEMGKLCLLTECLHLHSDRVALGP